jgi:hypothetical protein
MNQASTATRFGSLVLGFLSITAGCGGPHAAKVGGVVTLDGQPLTKGDVAFHPADGKGAVATGSINGQGHYELSTGTDQGLTPGAYLATVLATEEIPPARPGDAPGFRPTTPGKYGMPSTSGLKVDVAAGTNDIPLKLTSK